MGKLIIFSAPSGSGKTTIVKKVLQHFNNLEFSISACSRLPRGNEKNGIDYYFLSAEEFRNSIQSNKFVEWEEVYENQYYGTLISELDRIWKKGNSVVFDVDVVGGLNIKKKYQQNSLAIFIQPPSIDELEKRLRKRATDNEEQIKKRINKAEKELLYSKDFDKVILNDDLDIAVNQTIKLIENFISI
ncbi:MAG: guanylate kinase [Bacteroidales bacterium]|nr:guanylate kinase [Bacteroidales bacterium]MBN2758729.1 guanylate kinase [Bacteroidales bacterium]